MDRVLTRFIQRFGEPFDSQEVPKSSLERYKDKLPNLLLDYWAELGWCGFGEGIFWLVNPQEFEPVVTSWLEGTKLKDLDSYHLIARSAFGDLYFWGEETGASLKISSVVSRSVTQTSVSSKDQSDKRVQGFLLSKEVEHNDFGQLFKPAQKKLGTLRHDEMYGFVPALMLGGSVALEHLEKVKAVEHLIFLSQLGPLEAYSFSDF